MKTTFRRLINYTLIVFIALLGLGIYLANNSIKVNGNSMHPTFNTGDYISYQTYKNQIVNRGDILLFYVDAAKRYPNFTQTDDCSKSFNREDKCYIEDKLTYIKRVVALPGDSVKLINNIVYINGKAEKLNPPITFNELGLSNQKAELENENNNYQYNYDEELHHYIADIIDRQRVIEDRDYGIAEIDEYFVLGDNRDLSYDSRKMGYINQIDIRGIMVRVVAEK